MAFRLLATDLDGTLLRSDGTVSARTIAAVDAAESAGIGLVIVTGRPPRWIPPIIEQLGDRGLVVCANGGIVYDPARHEIIERNDMSAEAAAEAVRRLRSEIPELTFGCELGMDFAVEPAFAPHAQTLDDVAYAPIEDVCTQPVTKLLVRHPRPAPEGMAKRVRSIVDGLAGVTHSMDESFLELSRPDVHKASTLERLVAKSGIAAPDVVAFGDMPNDIEMIMWAGLGVAVGNAHPLVVEVADEVTASNDDDGVALVVERMLSSL